jgi:hypothetical protein
MSDADRLYHYCRNQHCRSKLARPTGMLRLAFCSRMCHARFYRQRCLVCEEATGSLRRPTCHRLKCQSAYRGAKAVYQWPGRRNRMETGESTSAVELMQKEANSSALKPAVRAGLPWRHVAGPPLHPLELRCLWKTNHGALDVWRRHEREATRALREAGIGQHGGDIIGGRQGMPIDVVGGSSLRRMSFLPAGHQAFDEPGPPIIPSADCSPGDGIPAFLDRRGNKSSPD